jgi:cold shock CspA family protein
MTRWPDDPMSRGTVVEFDAHRGLGVIEAPDGTRLDFHCTRIADGSRSVPVGEPVRFTVVPGALRRWEGSEIRPAAGAQPSAVRA